MGGSKHFFGSITTEIFSRPTTGLRGSSNSANAIYYTKHVRAQGLLSVTSRKRFTPPTPPPDFDNPGITPKSTINL